MSDPLSTKQLLSVRQAVARVNIWEGSVRSGKTIASLLRWVMYLATNDTQGELVVVSRTRDSAARNVFAPLADPSIFGELAHTVSYSSGSPHGEILGRRCWVLGSSDARSENVLRGLTCSGAYVDEITLLQEDFFVQLLNRLWEGAALFGTTNPDNPAHWFKRHYLDRLKDLPDWRRWHFLLDDNPRLSEARKDAIRRENVGLYYRRNVLGEWVAAEGTVYPQWDQDVHVIEWSKLPRIVRCFGVGIDYGTTNPSAALMLGLGDDSRLYLIDEWRYDPTLSQERLTDAQLSERLRTWLKSQHVPEGMVEPEWIYADPAAASFRVQLYADGVPVRNADNDVAYGIRTMGSLLGSGQLLVSDRCQGLINELPGYSWDDKATARGEDKPIKQADHSLDAARYIITTTESAWRGLLTLEAA